MPEIDYDRDKVAEMALALLYISLGSDGRAWKGMDWSISDRLYEKGWIENPHNKTQSFVLTRKGRELCIRLFREYFGKPIDSTGEQPENAPLNTLPIDVEFLVFLSESPPHDTAFHASFYLDTATGEILRLDENDNVADAELPVDIRSNPRYLRVPIWQGLQRKQLRQRVLGWLESQGIRAK